MKKRMCKISTSVLLLVTLMLYVCSPAFAYGPSTMYDPNSNSDASSVGAMYPRAIQLAYNGSNNGKMYATFQCSTTYRQTYPIYESKDSGANWAKVGDVQDTQHELGMNTNPHLFEMPQTIGSIAAGTILCAGICSGPDNITQFLDLYKSTDLGRTWTFVSTITSAPNAGSGDPVWEPFLMVANNKLICYYSDERDSAHSQKLVHQTTTDGTTWSSVVDDVSFADSSLRPGMCVVAKMANGNYVMTYELVGSNGTPCNYKISSNPESWNVSDYGTTITYGGSPYCVALNDGRIAVNGFDGTGSIYINTKTDLSGSWIKYSTPIQSGYSRQIVPLANGRLFITACQGFWESGMHPVYYCDMACPPNVPIYKIKNHADGYMLNGAGDTNGSLVTEQSDVSSTDLEWQIVDQGNGYVKIKNRTDGYVLNGGKGLNGSSVTEWSDVSSTNLEWQIIDQGDGYVKIKNGTDSLVLNGGGGYIGSKVTEWSDVSSTNLEWQIIDQGDGYVKIKNRTDGYMLSGGGSARGPLASEWSDGSSTNLMWQVTDQGNGYVKIKNLTDGLFLNGGGDYNGYQVTECSDGSSTNLEWQIIDQGDGYVKIKNHTSGLVLNGGGGSDGTLVSEWSDASSTNLEWKLELQ